MAIYKVSYNASDSNDADDRKNDKSCMGLLLILFLFLGSKDISDTCSCSKLCNSGCLGSAKLLELVEIETTKGGTPQKEKIQKCKLIHTHTARRTGATLMYLAGVDIYDIMKVTGHSSPAMLKKYIKADSLKVVEKLTDKYDYFK